MNNAPAETKNETAIPLSSRAQLFGRCISWIFWGILSVLLAVYCGESISSPDFWWHLKSGELMLNRGELLSIDPFNYTGDPTAHGQAATIRILKGYWLWQGVAALLYRIWGIYGIFVLKGVTLLLMIGGVLREMRRQSVSPFLQQLLIGIGAVIIAGYTLERPQIYSFIFATFLLGMVAQVRLGHRPSWMLLPLMVVWSNIHGGFVVGDILLILFSIGVIIEYSNNRARLISLLCWAFAGIVASFANPTSWNVFIEVFNFTQQGASNQINEYQSSWDKFQHDKLIGLLWLIVVLHVAGLFIASKKFWPEIFISVFLLVFGLMYSRNIPFIAVSLLPMTGWYLDRARTRLGLTQTRLWQTGVLLILMALITWQTSQVWQKRKDGWPVHNLYPEKMALFLRDSGLSGHLFNEYGTGGYLDWALYPKWQTFIDGRGLDYRVVNQYKEIIEGKERSEVLLEQYEIDVVAMNIRNRNGRAQPLLQLLLNSPRWIPVYIDWNYFVLARNSEKNSTAIKQFGIDKKVYLDSLLTLISKYLKYYPDYLDLTICYTELLLYAGKYPEAEVMLRRIERMRPGAEVIPLFKRQLGTLKVTR